MAALTVQNVALIGLAPAYAVAAGGGDTFVNNPDTFLHVKNGGASPITVTVVTPATVNSIAIADVAVSVPAAGERMIGPFIPTNLFNDSTGVASITYSAVTSVTVAAIRVAPV